MTNSWMRYLGNAQVRAWIEWNEAIGNYCDCPDDGTCNYCDPYLLGDDEFMPECYGSDTEYAIKARWARRATPFLSRREQRACRTCGAPAHPKLGDECARCYRERKL